MLQNFSETNGLRDIKQFFGEIGPKTGDLGVKRKHFINDNM